MRWFFYLKSKKCEQESVDSCFAGSDASSDLLSAGKKASERAIGMPGRYYYDSVAPL